MKKGLLILTLIFGYQFLLAKGIPKKPGEPEYLFVLQASSGSLTKNTLTIQKPHSTILAFSDRPYRDTFHMKSNNFLKKFNSTFKSSPPNGALIAEHIKGERPVAIELINPIKKGKSWVFEVKSLKNEKALPNQKNLKNIILFIDNGCNYSSSCSNNPCNQENCP